MNDQPVTSYSRIVRIPVIPKPEIGKQEDIASNTVKAVDKRHVFYNLMAEDLMKHPELELAIHCDIIVRHTVEWLGIPVELPVLLVSTVDRLSKIFDPVEVSQIDSADLNGLKRKTKVLEDALCSGGVLLSSGFDVHTRRLVSLPENNYAVYVPEVYAGCLTVVNLPLVERALKGLRPSLTMDDILRNMPMKAVSSSIFGPIPGVPSRAALFEAIRLYQLDRIAQPRPCLKCDERSSEICTCAEEGLKVLKRVSAETMLKDLILEIYATISAKTQLAKTKEAVERSVQEMQNFSSKVAINAEMLRRARDILKK